MISNDHDAQSQSFDVQLHGDTETEGHGRRGPGGLVGDEQEASAQGHGMKFPVAEEVAAEGHAIKGHLIDLDEAADDTSGHAASGRL